MTISRYKKKATRRAYNTLDEHGFHAAQILAALDAAGLTVVMKASSDTAPDFATELRKWWSFSDQQMHTHSWHSREDFIDQKLPELLAALAQHS